MSLQLAAQHLAAQGRGPDTTLVHMAPGEVQSLQAIAKAHGGSLTINPETGLPEAGFLSSILPMIAGAALAPLTAGTSLAFLGTPLGAGLAVGGMGALATGSLQKGLMAGLGAYGGAGLAGSVMNAGTGALSEAAGAEGLNAYAANPANAIQPVAPATPPISSVIDPTSADFGGAMFSGPAPATITPPIPAAPSTALSQEAINIGDIYGREQAAQNAVAQRLASVTPTETAKAGLGAIANKPSLLLNKENLKYGLSAAAPILTATPTMKGAPKDSNARIRDYVYDPISGTYEYIGARTPSEVAEQGTIRRAADGGMLVGYTDDYVDGYADGGPTEEEKPAASSISSIPMATDVAPATPSAAQLSTVTDIYRNTLGRDPDAEGLNYWAGRLAQGEALPDVYSALQGSARYVLGSQADTLAPRLGSTLEQATTPYTGFKSADATSIGDEWMRNVLGREATAADRALPWYQSLGELTTTGETDTAYKNFLRTYGLSTSEAPSWFTASQLTAPKVKPRITPATTGMMPGYTLNDSGIGSGLTRPEEPAGKTTGWTPGSAGIPTMQDVVNAYTQGGGMTGRLPYVPRSAAEQEQLYNRMTGDTANAYNYLMGRGSYPTAPMNRQVMRPYGESVLGLPASTYNQKFIFDAATQRYMPNPNYKAPVDPGVKFRQDQAATAAAAGEPAYTGLASMAGGGLSHLGDYSDGGRLLKGPGDGVSDSIPATIANKRPARLADGEFVVPARIVSELGNGSTDAGARKLYAMMNRIQSNRRKSVGKNKVAVNSKSDKYLPA